MKISRLPGPEIKIMFAAVVLSLIKTDKTGKGKVDGCFKRD